MTEAEFRALVFAAMSRNQRFVIPMMDRETITQEVTKLAKVAGIEFETEEV